jgi:hypothetical protein
MPSTISRSKVPDDSKMHIANNLNGEHR